MVEQAEQKGQGSGSRRMVVRTTQGSGPWHMVGHVNVRLEEGLVGSKFVIGPVEKRPAAGRMNERAKGLKPRHMTERDGYREGAGMWRAPHVLLGTVLAAEGHVELDAIAVSVVVIENCIEHV